MGRKFTGKFQVFRDRVHAGELLASLIGLGKLPGGMVLTIPNGGIPVGITVARRLNLGFDLAICRKLQIPWNTEAGFGAIAPDGSTILNRRLVEHLGLDRETIEKQKAKALRQILERERLFRGGEARPNLRGLPVLLVDDGLASGYTMLAAVRYAVSLGASKVFVGVPTASPGALSLVAGEVEKIYCVNVRSDLLGFAVADAYEHWYDLSDEEALAWLRKFKG
ncbi:MAG: phosphoribosyltransferase [Candidatus Hecatellaceae archaeon]